MLARLARTACVPLVIVIAGSAESPQTGSVTGQLVLLERPGAAQRDLNTAVVYLQSTDGRADDDHGAVPADRQIVMRGREFMPHVAVVQRGGTIAFPNQDPFSHNVFSNTDPVVFDLGLYRRGAVRSAIFGRAGVFPIYCNIHARMVSYVIAVPGRHVALADSDGRFTLPDVPVGTYRLIAWHERATRLSQELVVSASGATLRLELDARGYIAGAHLNKFGMPYTSTRSDRY
jgi:plastocyanin